MKRILSVLSVLLLVLCGCELAMSSDDPRIEIYIASSELEYCDCYKVIARKGNTCVTLDNAVVDGNRIILDTVTPGEWSLEVQAIVDGKVKGIALTDVYVNRRSVTRINIFIEYFKDYSFETFQETFDKVIKDNPRPESMPINEYLDDLEWELPTRYSLFYMDESDLDAFRTAMKNWFAIKEIKATFTVAKDNGEFRIVIDDDSSRYTIAQKYTGTWSLHCLDKILPEDMQSYLDELRTDSIARLSSSLPKVVLHDDYDRARILVDSFIDSLHDTTAFASHMDDDKAVVIGEFLQDVIDDMTLNLEFEYFMSIDVAVSSHSNVFMEVIMTVLDRYGDAYRYRLQLDSDGSWTAYRPDLPLWKPDQWRIDEALEDAARTFNEALASSLKRANPSTQGEMVCAVMDAFSSNLPVLESISSMGTDQKYLFERYEGKMLSDAFTVVPGLDAVPDVTLDVDDDYIEFNFIVVIHFDTGESYTYRYRRSYDGIWSHTDEYDDGSRENIPDATFDILKGNMARNCIEVDAEKAPGKGHLDVSRMDRTPLFWQMSELEIRNFKENAGANVHPGLTALQQKWVEQTFIDDARIVGNELRLYYSYCNRSTGKFCQALLMQHEDGSWEHRYVSEWIDLPSDEEIRIPPDYDAIRQELEVLESQLSQKLEADMPIYDLRGPIYNIGFLKERLSECMPPSNKYNSLTDAQAAMLEMDLKDVIYNCYALLPDFPERKLTLSVNVGSYLKMVDIYILFTLTGDSNGYDYRYRSNGEDGWVISPTKFDMIPPRCHDYEDIHMILDDLERETAGRLQENAMNPAPESEAERVKYLMDALFYGLPRNELEYRLTSRQVEQLKIDFRAVLERLLSKVTPVASATAAPGFTVKIQQHEKDDIYLTTFVDIGDGNTDEYVWRYRGVYGWSIYKEPTFPER